MYHPKRKVIFQPSFFRGYVKLREGIWELLQVSKVIYMQLREETGSPEVYIRKKQWKTPINHLAAFLRVLTVELCAWPFLTDS